DHRQAILGRGHEPDTVPAAGLVSGDGFLERRPRSRVCRACPPAGVNAKRWLVPIAAFTAPALPLLFVVPDVSPDDPLRSLLQHARDVLRPEFKRLGLLGGRALRFLGLAVAAVVWLVYHED